MSDPMFADSERRFLIFATALVAAALAAPLFNRSPNFSAAFYLIASSCLSLELIDVGARLWFRRAHHGQPQARQSALLSGDRVKPYALLLSVHNLRADVDVAMAGIAPLQHRAWIIDDASSDATALCLRAAGWRCLPSERNTKKPGALKKLLGALPADIETVLVLDPDSAPVDLSGRGLAELEAAIRRFQHSDAAACCPRIRIREDGPLASFQVLECEFAFSLGRKSLSPDAITSGVAIYDRRKLERALAAHSLSVYAEDLENTLLLLAAGERILYDDTLTVATDGKRHFRGWFSQRVGWSFGLLKVAMERRPEFLAVARRGPWAFYNFVVYLGLMNIVMLPIKLAGAALLLLSFANGLDSLFGLDVVPDGPLTEPAYFAATFVAYALLCGLLVCALGRRLRLRTLLIAVPFYSLYAFAHLVPVSLGYLNWVAVKLIGRRLYRDHFAADEGRAAPVEVQP